jgi:hypothetical protein
VTICPEAFAWGRQSYLTVAKDSVLIVSITSEGAVAGVLATSGAGLTIAAGAGDVINLRGLDIDGRSSGGFGAYGRVQDATATFP